VLTMTMGATRGPRSTLMLRDFNEALLHTYLVPFGATLINHDMNSGIYRKSDIAYLWGFVVIAFLLGRVAGSVLGRTGMLSASSAVLRLLYLLLVAVVAATGFVRDLKGLLIVRALTGLISKLLSRRYDLLCGAPSESSRAGPTSLTAWCLGSFAGECAMRQAPSCSRLVANKVCFRRVASQVAWSEGSSILPV
jgi:hypothetical protein